MKELFYGPVYINGGEFEGFFAYYDDDDLESEKAIVFFSQPLYSKKYFLVNFKYLSNVNTKILLERKNYFTKELFLLKNNSTKRKLILLRQLDLINSILIEMLMKSLFKNFDSKISIFLSHSSKDKDFVRNLAIDLNNVGIKTWFDEWDINIGESIPFKINEGLESSDFVLLILSKSSVNSSWVSEEWLSTYYSNLSNGKSTLLPILIEKCELPLILKHKKYINFENDYSSAFDELCRNIYNLKKEK